MALAIVIAFIATQVALAALIGRIQAGSLAAWWNS